MSGSIFARASDLTGLTGPWPLRDDVFVPLGETAAPSEQDEETARSYAAHCSVVRPETPLGADISAYQATGPHTPQPLATFQRLVRLGKDFVIVKSSQGTNEDLTFRGHYEHTRAAGMMRGAFHFLAPVSVSDQVRLFLRLVPRVTPGELPPALDVEDSSMVLWHHYQYRHGTVGTVAGSTALLDDVQEWLDRVEAALGRTPIIYTGVIWRDDLRSTRMSQYPLWTLPNRWFPAGAIGGWRRVELWQYAEDGKPWCGTEHYREPGVDLPGVDYDAYNGTTYGLRGLADLGRTGIGLTPRGVVVAHCEPDRRLHLMQESPPGAWSDTDLMSGSLPGLGGDPVLCTDGPVVRLYFRSEGRIVEAAQTSPGAGWDVEDLSTVAGVTAVHDPRAVAAGDRRVVVFSGDDDDWHLLSRTASAPWTATHLLSTANRTGTTKVPVSSGQPAVYFPPDAGNPRIVGRAGPAGHLIELALGNAGWAATDLTASSTGPNGTPPAATYSPAIYHREGETFIVYRAVRGELWQIARAARRAASLTGAAPDSQPAAGHPACFTYNGQAHVVYRGVDQHLHELAWRNGTWSSSALPCAAPMASDPNCADGGAGLVAFRAMDGTVHVLRFDGSSWTCGGPVPATTAPKPGPVPPQPPLAPRGSLFAVLGAAADHFRSLVADGKDQAAVSLAYQHSQRDVNTVTDLLFFARHPELGERRLRPQDTALAGEWRSIQERVTGPALAALARGGKTAPAGESRSHGEEGGVHDEGDGSVFDLPRTIADAGNAVPSAVAGVITGMGTLNFEDFIRRLDALEHLAAADGYDLTQRVTVFRKVFYDSAGSMKSYPGVPADTGVWNILLPGAASTPLPPSWRTPQAADQVKALSKGKEQIINGTHVDIGHVFTGLDARNHPTSIDLSVFGFPLVRMRSNLEAATFTGDLGSVVDKYLHGSTRSFRDTAMELDPKLLRDKYEASAAADMSGNADAHLVPLDSTCSLRENLCAYYTATTGGWRRRWQGFALSIGLGALTVAPAHMRALTTGWFSNGTERWRAEMQGEIMNAALAHAAATGHRSDIINVDADPGPGIFVPTFWEMYWNASGWVLSEFLDRLRADTVAELGG